MDTDSFIVCIKTEDIYVNMTKDIEPKYDTSNYELDRPLPNTEKKKEKVIGLIKMNQVENNERVCYIEIKNSCLIDNSRKDREAKGTKKCIIKRKLKFGDKRNILWKQLSLMIK